MRQFVVGRVYNAVLNGQDHTFEVIEEGTDERAGEFAIRWDDGDEEWAYVADMHKWTDAWVVKHVFKPVPKDFDPDQLLDM